MSADLDLETILTEVGEFGLFQIVSYILICIPSALSATYVVNFMISASSLEYRCKVPECDIGGDNRQIPFNQSWLQYAIPLNDTLENCLRYAPLNGQSANDSQCSADLFNTSSTIECSEYIYSSDERNIQTEFNIHCSDINKLAWIGTANMLGRGLVLPLIGLLSDKYGRLTVVVFGMMYGCVLGIIKSFSVNYIMYITLEFLESMATSTFAGIYLLSIEWVSTKYRVFGGALVAVSFPLGEMLLGFVAMYIHDFRTLIRVLYTPGLAIIIYLWIVPESVRWLLVHGKVDRAIKILQRIASVNGKTLSDKSIESIKMTYSSPISKGKISHHKDTENNPLPEFNGKKDSFGMILKSNTLCIRLLSCCYLWMVCCFCYYGLSTFSTHIPSGNRYTNFIFVASVEIPGLFVAFILLNHMKRRALLFCSFFVTALSIIITPLIPADNSNLILPLFMLGKASITCAFNALYIFTAEQWPTSLRSSIMNTCSMIGRIGAMIAPNVLATQYESLPAILFGGSAIFAAFIVLINPETFSKKLPDSIEEAKKLK